MVRGACLGSGAEGAAFAGAGLRAEAPPKRSLLLAMVLPVVVLIRFRIIYATIRAAMGTERKRFV